MIHRALADKSGSVDTTAGSPGSGDDAYDYGGSVALTTGDQSKSNTELGLK